APRTRSPPPDLAPRPGAERVWRPAGNSANPPRRTCAPRPAASLAMQLFDSARHLPLSLAPCRGGGRGDALGPAERNVNRCGIGVAGSGPGLRSGPRRGWGVGGEQQGDARRAAWPAEDRDLRDGPGHGGRRRLRFPDHARPVARPEGRPARVLLQPPRYLLAG